MPPALVFLGFRPETFTRPPNSTLICGLSFCARDTYNIALGGSCADNGRFPCTWKKYGMVTQNVGNLGKLGARGYEKRGIRAEIGHTVR